LDALVTGLLEGKRLLVTGVVTEASIAFSVARVAQEQGAQVVLTGFGRGLSITKRIANRLPQPAPVLELDVSDEDHLSSLAERLGEHVDGLDGVMHAIAFAPPAALGNGVLDLPWADAGVALQVSTWSLAALCRAALPMLRPGASVVGLDFDASVAWPSYDWMGVAKAGLESLSRYLARDLGPRGVRVNLVAAGPLGTMAAKSIPGFEQLEAVWGPRAPLGWNVKDAEPVARTCAALLSDWMPATTGEIIHVDGGVHAVGMAMPGAGPVS
jgi:enoyl-[acyl-carrier protein] reductase I